MRPLSTPTTPEQARTLWMGNVEPWMTPEFIQYELFTDVAAHIENVKMLKSRDGSPAGFCFVKFKGQEIAAEVLALYRGKPVGDKLPGRIFKLNYAGISARPQRSNTHQYQQQQQQPQQHPQQYFNGMLPTAAYAPYGASHNGYSQGFHHMNAPYSQPQTNLHTADYAPGPQSYSPHQVSSTSGHNGVSLSHLPFHGVNDNFSHHSGMGMFMGSSASSAQSSASSYSGMDELSDGVGTSHIQSIGDDDSTSQPLVTSGEIGKPHQLSMMRQMSDNNVVMRSAGNYCEDDRILMSARSVASSYHSNSMYSELSGQISAHSEGNDGAYAPGTADMGRSSSQRTLLSGVLSDTDSIAATSPNAPSSVDSTAAPRLLSLQPKTMVYLSNLPYGISEDQLIQIMQQFGYISRIRLRNAKADGFPSAFVTFSDPDAASECISSCKCLTIGGNNVNVSYGRSPMKTGKLPTPFTPTLADGSA